MQAWNINFFLAHGLVLIAWVVWFWRDRGALPRWRRYALLSGMLAVTVNILIFWTNVWYMSAHQDVLNAEVNGAIRQINMVGNWAILFLPVGLVSAICGKGTARIFVGLAAPSGFLLWVVPAIL